MFRLITILIPFYAGLSMEVNSLENITRYNNTFYVWDKLEFLVLLYATLQINSVWYYID